MFLSTYSRSGIRESIGALSWVFAFALLYTLPFLSALYCFDKGIATFFIFECLSPVRERRQDENREKKNLNRAFQYRKKKMRSILSPLSNILSDFICHFLGGSSNPFFVFCSFLQIFQFTFHLNFFYCHCLLLMYSLPDQENIIILSLTSSILIPFLGLSQLLFSFLLRRIFYLGVISYRPEKVGVFFPCLSSVLAVSKEEGFPADRLVLTIFNNSVIFFSLTVF